MSRLKIVRFSLTTLKGFNREKVTRFLNYIIFISFFALTAAVVSLYYENKIDQIDNKIINEETNILIYENQIRITPVILKNIEDVFFDNYKLNDYLKILELWNDSDSSVVSTRNTVFKPYYRYESVANYSLEQIKQSFSDAILVANSVEDLNEIELNDTIFLEIEKEIRNIISTEKKIRNEWSLQQNEAKDKKIDQGNDKDNYYRNYIELNKRLIQVLQNQINFFINFNIKYFSRKKNETEKIINNLENDLKKFSNQESRIILIAFILQLIIFLSVQYFEVTMESSNAKRSKKK